MITFLKKYWHALIYEGYEPAQQPAQSAVAFEVPKYPPVSQGLPLVPVEQVIHSQQDLIDRIQKTSGITKDSWSNYMLPLINNLARYVHLLPASSIGEYKGAGGLLRMSLEIGFYSLQTANATIFSSKGSSSPEIRYKLHPKWTYATFAAAVCSVLYRIPSQMVITDERGTKWSVHLEYLYDWGIQHKAERYFVVWNDKGYMDESALQQGASTFLMGIILPKQGLQFISDDNNDIVPAMTSAVAGTTPLGVKNQIDQILKTITKQLIQRDLKRNAENYGEFTVGSHMEPVLLDGMRKLIKKGTWSINSKGARIWHSKEGMFIVWGLGTKELLALLAQDNLTWLPSDPDTLADILIAADIAESNGDDGRYWDICVPPNMQIIQAIKLTQVDILFNDSQSLDLLDGYLLPKNLQVATTTNKPAKEKLIKQEVKDTQLNNSPQNIEKDVSTIQPVLPVIALPALPGATKSPEEKKIDEIGNKPSLLKEANQSLQNIEETNSIEPSVDTPENADSTELSEQSVSMIKTLPPDLSSFLMAIVEDHRDKSSGGPVFSVPEGVFVSIQEMEAHGQTNFTGLLQALETKCWLWSDPTKLLRKLFEVPHAGGAIKGIIIRGDIARLLGFNWKPPKIKPKKQGT